MNQKFSGDVGQVAGHDVKSNSAQASVNLHFHSGESKPVVTKVISDRQRNVIARKAFEIQGKTGTDKLMVYRRLMTVFNFKKMDDMPRDVYERALKYLDGWIRNGTMLQVPVALKQTDVTSPSSIETSKPSIPAVQRTPRHPLDVVASAMPPTASHPTSKRQWTRYGVTAPICLGLLVLAAIFYFEIGRRPATEQVAATEATPLHCEYGGSRYTVGSIVMQAGKRARCIEAVGHGVEWQPLATSKRH
ncbi:hypothetical protein [Burkholderia mayonis]|uniref:Phage-encoded membrane protein n=1 Tax=Burkholderia mayonis TaxID=1385591 RepID=A0A1B4G6Y4_9BURK|nr:hypothetical protein [Burkholderia mayonis]AOJ11686.1 hypothetical protein WS71_32115 [Burkholderia mayonis]KVE54591.1 hypothetical protein WS71_03975 [Burkholderia mayonis]